MTFIIKANDKVVYAVNSQYKDPKKGYIRAQELINKFLYEHNIDKYKFSIEH